MKPNKPGNRIVRMMREGIAHHQAGRLDQAGQIYQQVLGFEPRNPDALHLLGLIEQQRGRFERAAELIEEAARIKPGEPVFLVNLAPVYGALNRLEDAENSQRRAIQLNPRMVEAHANLAAALRKQGKLDEARVAALRAIELNPNHGGAHLNLGNVYKDCGDLESAAKAYEIAMRTGAARHEVMSNLGDVLRGLGRWVEARSALEEAIRIAPTWPLAHWNLSLMVLLSGDYPRGFEEHEWRLKHRPADVARFARPQWTGQALNGQTILLWSEQGFGDAIQFVRYAPLVADRGGRVVLECQPALRRLLGTVSGISNVIARGEVFPDHQFHAPLMSLPHIFGTTVQTIPATVPYLRVEGSWIEQVKHLITREPGVRNIGLAWAGNPAHVNDRRRSIPLTEFAPLAAVPGLRWFSLQFGPAHQQQRHEGLNPIDLSTHIHDFADSAAIMSLLDLIITVDTAPAHLAGALARPVWTLLPYSPDWRWLLNRSDTPWYPTLRLFRQESPGNWEVPIAGVVEAISQLDQG